MNAMSLQAQARNGRRVLVSSIASGTGGVAAMTRFVVRTLKARGLEPVLAWYEPYSVSPSLSTPAYRLLRRRPGFESRQAYDGCESYAIGAWLPELEFTHYWATGHWGRLMESCDAFLAVSGNVLAATAFYQTQRPYVAWVATDWHGDRKDRVREFPWPRRLLDQGFNRPVITALERKLLGHGRILSLSDFTSRCLMRASGAGAMTPVLRMPVDTALFAPGSTSPEPARIGFAGRFSDRRKNAELMIRAIALLIQRGLPVTGTLVGDQPSPELSSLAVTLGVGARVEFMPPQQGADLRDTLRRMDVFVVPSHQEGLCIAALEAMSCGVPVVSTRCGGPEDFVLPGVNGSLVGFQPEEMADVVQAIISDRPTRDRMAWAARRTIEESYTSKTAEDLLMATLHSTFPNLTIEP